MTITAPAAVRTPFADLLASANLLGHTVALEGGERLASRNTDFMAAIPTVYANPTTDAAWTGFSKLEDALTHGLIDGDREAATYGKPDYNG